MSVVPSYQPRGGHFSRDGRSSHCGNNNIVMGGIDFATGYICNFDKHSYNHDTFHDFPKKFRLDGSNIDHVWPASVPSSKRRKVSASSFEVTERPYQLLNACAIGLANNADLCELVSSKHYSTYRNGRPFCNNNTAVAAAAKPDYAICYTSTTSKRDRSEFEDEVVFLSRDEIERWSPSRKDGIDALHEAHLRYSYCGFLQNLGFRLDLPQTTIGTAMVLCHRFFVRRSHASHDRFLIATAALFLASKSEETPRPLNDMLRMSCEILHKQDFALLSYMFPIDWFEQYRERITEAEQLILTTLNFELNVQHPYESLTSTLQKLGFSQPALVNLALSLVSEGLRSSLWLQFKPHQIAAGSAYLAAKFLNMNLSSCHNVWREFHTPPSVLKDVAHQLIELF